MPQVVVTHPSMLAFNTGNNPGEEDWTVVNDKLWCKSLHESEMFQQFGRVILSEMRGKKLEDW
jgi:hypothetical protein